MPPESQRLSVSNDVKDLCCIKLVYKAMSRVDQKYSSFVTADILNEERRIARERVYAYELYHQMRCLQDQGNFAFFDINAEVDKAGHTIIEENFKPDIIIHKQGDMDHNLCVMEVKVNFDREGIRKDFETILTMMEKYRYSYGIFIIINMSIGELITQMGAELRANEQLMRHASNLYLFAKENRLKHKTLLRALAQGQVGRIPVLA